eukprot:751676-Hanusia_phi.AAC.1
MEVGRRGTEVEVGDRSTGEMVRQEEKERSRGESRKRFEGQESDEKEDIGEGQRGSVGAGAQGKIGEDAGGGERKGKDEKQSERRRIDQRIGKA